MQTNSATSSFELTAMSRSRARRNHQTSGAVTRRDCAPRAPAADRRSSEVGRLHHEAPSCSRNASSRRRDHRHRAEHRHPADDQFCIPPGPARKWIRDELDADRRSAAAARHSVSGPGPRLSPATSRARRCAGRARSRSAASRPNRRWGAVRRRATDRSALAGCAKSARQVTCRTVSPDLQARDERRRSDHASCSTPRPPAVAQPPGCSHADSPADARRRTAGIVVRAPVEMLAPPSVMQDSLR